MISLTKNLTPETYEKIIADWLKVVKRRECASIIHLPKRDQLYRIHAFLESTDLINKHIKAQDTQIILLDLTAQPIEDSSELERFIHKKIKNQYKHLILFVLDADKLINEKVTLISALNNLYHRIKHLSIFYLFGHNITYPQFMKKLSAYTSLYQNILIFPYLDIQNSHYFVNYLKIKLNTNIPDLIKNKIVSECGGICWIIKQACRHYGKTNSTRNMFDHEDMIIKINMLVDEFIPEEKHVLEKVLRQLKTFTTEEKHILSYLVETNTLYEKNNLYHFSSPLIEKHFKSQVKNKLNIESINSHDISINNVVMNNYFSKRERKLLIYFVKHKDTITSRETVANIVWKDDPEMYTDWALDQFIRRLRKKLISLGFDKEFIKTVKNQGFLLT